MKVGVDGVLLGAIAGRSLMDEFPRESEMRVLDVGTGCGLIALMLAQRFPQADVTAIDIHRPSVEEAAGNFIRSPWSQRLRSREAAFPDDLSIEDKFDLIVSNPPFFDAGVANPSTPREKARHVGSLSPLSLLREGTKFLNPGGHLAIIFPYDHLEKIFNKIRKEELGIELSDICFVRNNSRRPVRRVVLEVAKTERKLSEKVASVTSEKKFPELDPERISVLTMMEGNCPSAAYRNLTKDFYLKF